MEAERERYYAGNWDEEVGNPFIGMYRKKSFVSSGAAGFLPWAYLVGVTAAELLVGLVSVRWGMILHIFLMLCVLGLAVAAARPGRWEKDAKSGILPVDEDSRDSGAAAGSDVYYADPMSFRFYLSLALAPMIRVLSLALPLKDIPVMYWFLIVGAPLFAAAYVVVRLTGYRKYDICLMVPRGRWLVQAGIALTGIPLGVLEFTILKPSPLVSSLTFGEIILPSLILIVFTGFMEELIFRGILQRAAQDVMGGWRALLYVGLLFAVLHITHLSALDVLFVWGVALLFSLFVRNTGSLLGVTLAHGFTNIGLYIIWPLLFR